MSNAGEKRFSQRGFVNIQTTAIELDNRYASAEDDEAGRPHVDSPSSPDLVDKWWLWEIFAWTVSLLGLIGVYILLSCLDGKKVPDWTVPKGRYNPVEIKVTINSVISLLATLVKSSLFVPLAAAFGQQKWLWFQGGAQKLSDFQKFDAANRGPLGALILIWSLRARRLACLGAIIVIAALGLDFSFQQLITYPVIEQRVTDAHMPKSTSYNITPSDYVPTYAGGSQKSLVTVDPALLSAMYGSLFSTESEGPKPVEPDCATGNCTWSLPYTSIGICGMCYEITDMIQTKCETIQLNYTSSVVENQPLDTLPSYEGTTCTYYLPHGVSTTEESGFSGSMFQSSSFGDTINLIPNVSNFNKLVTPITAMVVLNTTFHGVEAINDSIGTKQPRSLLTSSFAAECALQYCVRRYEGNMTSGVLSEVTLDTFFNESAAFESSGQLSIQPPASFLAPEDTAGVPYTVDTTSGRNLGYMFLSQDTCTDSNSVVAPENCPYTIWRGNVYATGNTVMSNSDVTRHLYGLNFTQLAHMIDSMAESLTSTIRSSLNTYNANAVMRLEGTSWLSSVTVRVRWPWMAVPTVLLALTLLFMALTAVQTSRTGAMMWKGSSLPAFYYPLTKDGRSQLSEAAGSKQMENVANGMRVKWQMTESGMRLVKVD